MLIRLAALSIGPILVMYGLAAVWRIASPVPKMNKPVRKILYVLVYAAGTNKSAPNAIVHNPIASPFFIPDLSSKKEAGTDMIK